MPLHVEFLEVDAVFVDLRERELLTEPVSLALIARQIDYFCVQVRFIMSPFMAGKRIRGNHNGYGLVLVSDRCWPSRNRHVRPKISGADTLPRRHADP